jgi:hypothetical protein
VLKIVLGVVAFFVLIGVAGMATCGYLAYRAKQKFSAMADEARKGTLSTESGTPEIHVTPGGAGSQPESVVTADVPQYPNSTATESGGGMSIGGVGGISSQEFETTDSVEQVLDFYKEKLGSNLAITQAEGNAEFTYAAKSGVTTVTLTRDEDAGKTKITIARMGK